MIKTLNPNQRRLWQRLFGALLMMGLLWQSQSAATEFDYQEVQIDQLQAAMAADELQATQIVRHYYQQIAQHNRRGADLRAVNSLLPLEQALSLAQELDAERDAGEIRGPLHGIPVLLKDNIDTADGLANTAGSLLLKNHYPARDAFLVQRLREAGAIIIGKANLSEWANFRSTASSSGWSSVGGQTKNPFDTTRSTCGSSAGSAAAVSGNLIPLAVGTETDGSLVCPAAITGIVSLKPTVGLVSRSGIIPISHSQDTAGPMARTVRDAVYLMQAMLGPDSTDAASYQQPTDFTQHLQSDGLRGKRIGVVRDFMGYHSQLDARFEAQLEVLREAGAIVVDNVEFVNGRGWGGDEFTVLLHEFKTDMASYLAQHPSLPYRSLDDLIAANTANADTVMPFFGQELFTMAAARTEAQESEYQAAAKRAKEAAGPAGIDATLAAHDLDLLIAPTTAPAWKIDLINGDHYMGSASSAAAVAGYPHITVPMGFVQHLPVGLSFFAGAKTEGLLIEAAYGYEQASKARRAPALMPRQH
ncbi:Glutamyl-tRNA(Gln) amidotransferase subunit A [Pseudidiomarina piscicola]|uniref:Glutamyl-tRNA(Gln) amidotransferase subunit A n=1 Tax=Pseudidiomarina piscicola TaxID=2614830 RepID=A0A6S6WPH9_9GAMM|nr:amidase [Pseudidiomarina piscicola]CAB0151979.1 Glutamyl-tRNA(Gln) amidotransferase subunit A [Pseudidiomarina piscicola]VZT41417.1 Glutamyl-tRNA(Gln) amidotransferase subunit A [Pseudomonas aeruginosa]